MIISRSEPGRQATERVRVLRVIDRLNIGGPARHAILLNRALEERGLLCELVSGREGAREGRIEPAGVHHATVPSLKRAVDPVCDARAALALAGITRRYRPHIVHTHKSKAGVLGRTVAWRARVPVIVHTFHGHVLSEYFSRLASESIARIERVLARRTDALISVSAGVRDDLLARGIGRPDQWRVIPVGLDLEPLLAGTHARAEARALLGLPTGPPIIGIVGRLVPVKDHATFLRAAVQVARAVPDARFLIAGDGELRDSLEREAARMLGDRVIFLGWASDLPMLYGALDVVVLTSLNEGTPVALIEAGAAGRPVVATRVGGVQEVVRHGQTGLLSAAGSPESIAAHVASLLENLETARRMGIAGREWVRSRFSIERLRDDIEVLYAELLARKGWRSEHAPYPAAHRQVV